MVVYRKIQLYNERETTEANEVPSIVSLRKCRVNVCVTGDRLIFVIRDGVVPRASDLLALHRKQSKDVIFPSFLTVRIVVRSTGYSS